MRPSPGRTPSHLPLPSLRSLSCLGGATCDATAAIPLLFSSSPLLFAVLCGVAICFSGITYFCFRCLPSFSGSASSAVDCRVLLPLQVGPRAHRPHAAVAAVDCRGSQSRSRWGGHILRCRRGSLGAPAVRAASRLRSVSGRRQPRVSWGGRSSLDGRSVWVKQAACLPAASVLLKSVLRLAVDRRYRSGLDSLD